MTPVLGNETLGKLEDITADNLWREYETSQLPPVEETGEFIREQLRKAMAVGAWTMLALEDRLRRETPERRTALLDRFRAEYEKYLRGLDGDAVI